MKYDAELDGIRRVHLVPAITRAFWSRRCAWPGDRLLLQIETRNVPDGTAVAVTLVEEDADEGNPDDVLGPIPGSHVIHHGRCTIEYVLDLSSAALGQELEVEGDAYEFCFDVAIEAYDLVRRSTRLYVPIEPFQPSR